MVFLLLFGEHILEVRSYFYNRQKGSISRVMETIPTLLCNPLK